MAIRPATYAGAGTLKTVLINYSTGTAQWWNTSTPGFENYNSANIANYGIATSQDAGSDYTWTIPSTLGASTAGFPYRTLTLQIAGSNLATGDLLTPVYEDSFVWSGSVVYTAQNTLLNAVQTGVTIPTVTTVGTLSTYTGNTPQTGDAYGQLNTLVSHAFTYDANNLPKVDLVDVNGTASISTSGVLTVNATQIAGNTLAATTGTITFTGGATVSTLAAGAQMDLVNAPNATALTAIATAIWAFGTRTLSSFGTLVSTIAAAILKTPANLLATDASGDVAVNNLPADYLSSGEQAQLTDAATGSWYTPPSVPTAAAIAVAVNTDTINITTPGSPGFVVVNQLGGAFGISGSVFTAGALANAPTGGGSPIEVTITPPANVNVQA